MPAFEARTHAQMQYSEYTCTKLDPFVSKLLESIYIHLPENVEDFTRDYLSGKLPVIEDNEATRTKRASIRASISESKSESKEGNDSEGIDEVSGVELALENKSLREQLAAMQKRVETLEIANCRLRGDTVEDDELLTRANRSSSFENGSSAVSQVLSTLRYIKKLITTKVIDDPSLNVSDINMVLELMLHNSSDQINFNVDSELRSLETLKTFEKNELDAIQSYFHMHFTTGDTRRVSMDSAKVKHRGPCRSSHSMDRDQIDSIVKISDAVDNYDHTAALLMTYDDWNFDAQKLAEFVPSVIVFSMAAAVVGNGLSDSLGLDMAVFKNFFKEIEKGYDSSLSYHNAVHAADVVHSAHYFIHTGGLKDLFSEEMQFTLLLSAAVHDVGHIGVNNAFLAKTKHPYALRYSDISPLENFHVATAFELMSKSADLDVLAVFTGAERQRIRQATISMVLGTDNSYHSKFLGKLSSKIEVNELDLANNWRDQLLVLKIVLHAADVSNPAKEWKQYNAWTDLVLQEFFNQGEKEREAGLPVTPGYDKYNPIPRPKMQAGFIHALCLPLYRTLDKIDGFNFEEPVAHLQENLVEWHKQIDLLSPRKA